MNRKKNYRDKEKARQTAKKQKKRYYDRTSGIYDRRLYTAEEDRIIMEHKIPDREISELIKRSQRSILLRRYRLRKNISELAAAQSRKQAEKQVDYGENFRLWVKGNEINNTEIWKLGNGFYETKRKNQYTDGYLSPVFFVWDLMNDRMLTATLNYEEAYAAWQRTVCGNPDGVFFFFVDAHT